MLTATPELPGTAELRTRETRGRRTETVGAVVRTLRRTPAWTARRGGDPEPRCGELVIRITSGGEAELWHRGAKVPVESRTLRNVFQEAGVPLAPGTTLLADPDLARQAIEKSLVGWSLEELRLRRTKSLLLRALVDLPLRAPEGVVHEAPEGEPAE